MSAVRESNAGERRARAESHREAGTPVAGRDPGGRREAIVAAALEVIATEGYDNATHRQIAERAGVPLGSTTYYFPTLADLLGEAVELARRECAEWVERLAADVETVADLAPAIAASFERYVTEDRRAALIDLEVYVASARDERLATVAREWNESLFELIEPLAGAEAAVAITALLDGQLMAALITGGLDREALERAVAKLIG